MKLAHILLALMLWPFAANAQDSQTGQSTTDNDTKTETQFSIAGAWSFETQWYATAQKRQLRGEMIITPDGAGGLSCRITNGEYNANEDEPFVHAVQACTVRRVYNALLVRSEVISSSSTAYQPDHFNLRIVDADTMIGEAFSWGPMGDVKFIRIEHNVS